MVNETEPHPGWRNAVAVFFRDGKGYGDLLSFAWLYEAFRLSQPGDDTPNLMAEKLRLAFLNQLQRFADELLTEHQMALVSERSVGYRVLHPNEQTKYAEDDARLSLRRALRREAALLTNVNLAPLTARERQENADALARLSNLRAKTKEVYPPRAIESAVEGD